MPPRFWLRATLGVTLSLGFLSAPSCVDVDRIEDTACAVASDCAPPFVCCSAPRTPSEDTPKLSCQDVGSCDAYLPFLLEGQPCGRLSAAQTAGTSAPANPCSAGLVCCPGTLTCGKDGACPEAPVPPATPSGATCLSDPDCPSGEICCNIDFFNRNNGKCSAVLACQPLQPS